MVQVTDMNSENRLKDDNPLQHSLRLLFSKFSYMKYNYLEARIVTSSDICLQNALQYLWYSIRAYTAIIVLTLWTPGAG